MLSWFTVQENFAQLWDGSPSVKHRPAAIKGTDSDKCRCLPWLNGLGRLLEQSSSTLLLRRGPLKLIPHGCLVLAVYLFKQCLIDINAQRVRG